MVEMNSRSYRILTASLIYLIAIAGALTIATLRSRAKAKPAESEPDYSEPVRRPAGKPFFSLTTHRTYGSTDNARIWVDYQGLDHLDFRVYQVRDPRKFFAGLKNPHQMGSTKNKKLPARCHTASRFWKGCAVSSVGHIAASRRLSGASCNTILARLSIKSFAKKQIQFVRR